MRRRFVLQTVLGTLALCQFSVAASAKAIDFALVNGSPNIRCEVARVSLPVPRGAAPSAPANWLTVDGKPTRAQARVVTSYPDGSPRRIIISFLAELASQQRASSQYDPCSILSGDRSLNRSTYADLHVEEGNCHILSPTPYTLWIENDRVTVNSISRHALTAEMLRGRWPRNFATLSGYLSWP